MDISNDKQLSGAITNVKKYLLDKLQKDMGNVPTEKLKKAKMVISTGGPSDVMPPMPECGHEGMSDLDKIKQILKLNQSEPEVVDDVDMGVPEDSDLEAIKRSMAARKGAK